MILYKVTTPGSPNPYGWLLITDDYSMGDVAVMPQDLAPNRLSLGIDSWKDWIATLTVLNKYTAPSLEELFNQIPEEFI